MSGTTGGSAREGRPVESGSGPARRSSAAAGHEPSGGHPEDPPGDPEAVARSICLKLLTMSPKTRAQLAEALAARGVPDRAAEAVLDRYTEVGLIDDAAFAEAWVTTRQSGRGLATRALAQELHHKGIAKEIAEQALSNLDPDTEMAAAVALVQRKLRSVRNVEPHVARRRLLGMLARKGYPHEMAARVVGDQLALDRDELAARRPSTG